MKKIIFIFLVLCLASCNNISNTENETNAVQQVLNFYGGECLKNKGVESINGITKTYFEIEISKSKLLNTKPQNIKAHSANIAYLFYGSFNNENTNYDEVRVKIILSDGKNEVFKYSIEELNEIQKIQPLLKNISDKIIEKNHKKLTLLFDETVAIDSTSIAKLFNDMESQYGSINKIQFQGLEFRESKNFGNVILTRQAIVLEKIDLSMNIIFKRDNNKIISIEFD